MVGIALFVRIVVEHMIRFLSIIDRALRLSVADQIVMLRHWNINALAAILWPTDTPFIVKVSTNPLWPH